MFWKKVKEDLIMGNRISSSLFMTTKPKSKLQENDSN